MTDPTQANAEPCGPLAAIREWFAAHDDGEFSIPPWDAPYLAFPPPLSSKYVLYTTKPQSILALFSHESSDFPCGVIGRYGLPNDSDVPWLRSCASGRRFLFVGDADPCDLLVFAWLRSRVDIAFRGLSDTVLNACGVSITDSITIWQSDSESAAMPLVHEHLPEFADLVGHDCAAVILSGRKIEVESLIGCTALAPLEVIRAIVG